jgi:hypothetical protein
VTAGVGDPNAIAKLAKISGDCSGSRILLIAARGGAPRSMAASYSLPIDNIRRTMMTG